MSTADTEATHSGASNDAGPLSLDEGASAFMKRWEDADKPSETEDEAVETDEDTARSDDQEDGGNEEADQSDEQPEDQEEAEEPDEDDEDDGTDEDDGDEETDEEEAEEGEEPEYAADDAPVKVKVGDEELEVKVGDLKRLYGQEQALTKRSQQLAEQRKETHQVFEKHSTALNELYNRAASKLQEYEALDWNQLQQELAPEQYEGLRAEAQRYYQDAQFYHEELDSIMQERQRMEEKYLAEQGREAVETLRTVIPDWDNDYYNNLRSYAVENGLEKEAVDKTVDPNVFILLDKARKYDESKKAATTKIKKAKANTKKKILASKKGGGKTPRDQRVHEANRRLAETGSIEAGADAFMAGWGDDD